MGVLWGLVAQQMTSASATHSTHCVTEVCDCAVDTEWSQRVQRREKLWCTKSRCLAPSQRPGRLGRARRHTADAVRHWATNLVSAAPSTKPSSRFLGAKSAATSHRARAARPCDRQRLGQRAHKGQYYDALHVHVKTGIVKMSRRKPGRHRAANQENHLQLRQRGRQPERRRPHRAPTTHNKAVNRPRRPQPSTKGLTGGLNRQPDG